MSPVVRRFGIAFLQFLSGAGLLYLANRLSAHDPAANIWVDRLVNASSFGTAWWTLVLTGLGAALVLLALPSPWRGDRPTPARATAQIAPTTEIERPRQLAAEPIIEAPIIEARAVSEAAIAQAATPVLRPPEPTSALTPSFRSKPSPPRPLRRLVVTRQTALVEE